MYISALSLATLSLTPRQFRFLLIILQFIKPNIKAFIECLAQYIYIHATLQAGSEYDALESEGCHTEVFAGGCIVRLQVAQHR